MITDEISAEDLNCVSGMRRVICPKILARFAYLYSNPGTFHLDCLGDFENPDNPEETLHRDLDDDGRCYDWVKGSRGLSEKNQATLRTLWLPEGLDLPPAEVETE